MAVPVRAELAATVADYEARKKRAILRPVRQERERLQARADPLPTPKRWLQPHAQALDELSERLRAACAIGRHAGRERRCQRRRGSATVLERLREAHRARDKASPALVERPLGGDASGWPRRC